MSDSSCAGETEQCGRRTPTIPNVVEYHLKVKPQCNMKTSVETTRENKNSGDETTWQKKKKRKEREREKEREKEQKLVREREGEDEGNAAESMEKQKELLLIQLSALSTDRKIFQASDGLPQVFQAKYLGSHDARGLWGIKHTRVPVDNMVAAAKSLPSTAILPIVKLLVSAEGVLFMPLEKKRQDASSIKVHSIDTISYGVQDLVYTRVFSMIVVRESENFRRTSPFQCHAFVCESKQHARQLTHALAAAFEIYSSHAKKQPSRRHLAKGDFSETHGRSSGRTSDETNRRNNFSIDLRSDQELQSNFLLDSEA